MEIRLLGPLEVLDDQGLNRSLGGPKPRALLALLALGTPRTASVDSLVDVLWPEAPPKTAVKTIQTYVVQLRRALGAALVTRHGGYRLDLQAEQIDSHLFERLILQAEQEVDRPTAALTYVDHALALWRGDPMPDLRFSPPLAVEATRLHDLRLRALQLRAGALLELGRHDDVLAEVSCLVEEHPLREALWVHLIIALYRSGRHAEALRAFQRARKALGEVGLDPSPDLVALEEAIVGHDPALRPSKPSTPGPVPLASILAPRRGGSFVGRETERRAVEEAWVAAAAGDPRVVVVTGEPGIGKSRLAAEVAARVAAGGAVVLSGRCDEGGLLPFQPFIEALRQYAAVVPHDALERALALGGGAIVRLIPELAQRMSPPDSEHGEQEPDRFTLFQSLMALLGDASRRAPLMLVLDDLHWADDATLLLLRHVMRAPGTRLMVLATFRDTEVGQVLADHLALLAREVEVVRVGLEGLSQGDVSELVREKHPDSAERVSRLVYQATQGNPFFVEEVLHDLSAAQDIAEPADVGLPVEVREVIESRLARLPPGTNRLLEAASVIGAEFDVGLLSAVARVDEDAVVDALDRAARLRLLCEVAGTSDCYRFSHALVRATLLGRLSASRRTRLHRSVAEVLERVEAKEPGAHIAQLAHHLGEAGTTVEVERVVDASVRAALNAIEQFAYEDAVRHYERALSALERVQPVAAQQRCELLCGKAEAQVLAGQVEEGNTTCLAAADLARAMASPLHLARAAITLSGGGLVQGAAEELLIKEALERLPNEEAGLRAVLLAQLIRWLVLVRDDEYLLTLATEAVSTARGQGDEKVLVRALVGRLYALHMPHHAEEKLLCADELQLLASRTGDHHGVIAAERHRLWALLQLGDAQVWDGIDDFIGHAQRVGGDGGLMFAAGFATLRLTMAGRFAEAEGAAQELTAWDPPYVRGALSLMTLTNTRRFQGRLGELEESHRQFVERAPSIVLFRSGLGLVLAETERLPEARMVIEDVAGDDLGGLPRNRFWSPVVSHVATTAAIVGHSEIAGRLYEELLPYRGRNLVFGWEFLGAADHHLGVLAEALGGADDARRHLEAALVQYERIGVRPWAVLAQVALARVLLAAGVEREHAASLLTDALHTAEAFGMRPAAAESSELLHRHALAVSS